MLLAVITLSTVYLVGDIRAEIKRRVIDGVHEDIEFIPWLASYGSLCGGAIVSESHVLTAASCGTQAFVRVKSTTLRADGEVIIVDTHIPHPQYKKDKHEYDYLLLKLASDIKMDCKAQAIPLYSGPELAEATMVTFAGYGRTLPDVTSGHHSMTYGEVPVINEKDCKKANPNFPLTKTMFCAGYEEGTIGACMGDRGNPVSLDNELVGIVIMESACGKKGGADIYAKIVSVKNWIEDIINK